MGQLAGKEPGKQDRASWELEVSQEDRGTDECAVDQQNYRKDRQISTAKCRGSSQDLPRERTVKRYAPKSKFTGAV